MQNESFKCHGQILISIHSGSSLGMSPNPLEAGCLHVDKEIPGPVAALGQARLAIERGDMG